MSDPAITELQRIARRVSPAGAPDSSIERKRALLNDAIAACTGDRHLNYGKPEANFQRIAILWNAWNETRKPGPIEPWEVAVFMSKLARLAHAPTHRDSWLDIAGYGACGADITEAR
jgi:Domain of unknown function (DUF6378)